MLEQPPKLKDPAFWAYALRYALMWTVAVVAAIGFSRFLNTLLRRGILFELDFPAWLPTYLMVSGFVQLVLGMVAYIALKENRTWHLPFLWITTLLMIASTWGERLFLWVPDQRPTNHTFTIILHLVWLLMMVLYTVKAGKKEPADGPGN